jgi:hypothetical protein
MKRIVTLLAMLTALFSTTLYAGPYAEACANLQNLAEQAGKNIDDLIRSTGVDFMIDECKKEDKTAIKEIKQKMDSGTLYCKSGSLCAKYDFQYPEDRKKYVSQCSQVPSCDSHYSDKCSVTNDKVRNGRGTVDWTLFAYGTDPGVWKNAKGVNCN